MKIKQYQFGLLLSLAVLFCFSSLNAQQTNEQKGEKKDTAAISGAIDNDENKIYSKPEVKASVDSIAWRKHLYKQISLFLLQPSVADIPPGKYAVKVRFIVEKDGSISDVKAVYNPGYGLAEAAINVVKTVPKWKAAEQAKNKVRSYHIQPISFFIQNKKPSTL